VSALGTQPGKPWASLSLDLDNEWAYLKTRGDASWQNHPSYLHVAVPVLLSLLDAQQLKLTVFVVGQDAALPVPKQAIRELAQAGHEIGNHSMFHEPWMAARSPALLHAELHAAEQAIEAATGARPRGFRGPGFALSGALLQVLAERGYLYDASTFPSALGPLARWAYRLRAGATARRDEKLQALFGGWREALRPLVPYRWLPEPLGAGSSQTQAQAQAHAQSASPQRPLLIELPVTTMPLLRLPMHMTYLLFLAQRSAPLALAYFKLGLALCRWRGVAPSLLLHPLDVLDAQQVPRLAFFPAMAMPAARKREFVVRCLAMLQQRFEVLTVGEHALRVAAQPGLRNLAFKA
jgi:peptidoglycan-N-acetylglucosamine deacetylase